MGNRVRLPRRFAPRNDGLWQVPIITGKGDWYLGGDEVIPAGLWGEVFPLCTRVLTAARWAPAVDGTAAQSVFVITQKFARVGELAAHPATVTKPAPGV